MAVPGDPTIFGPQPQLKQNGWFPSNIAWADYTGNRNPLPDDAAMSYEGGNQAVKHIIILAADIYQAIGDLCGTNVLATGNTGGIPQQGGGIQPAFTRILPMQHPIHSSLFVTRLVSMKEYIVVKKDKFPGSTTKITTTVPRFFILSILFQQPKYRMLTDSQADDPGIVGTWSTTDPNTGVTTTHRSEFSRFIEGWPRPRTEFINQEANSVEFAETGSGLGSDGIQSQAGPPVGTAFSASWSFPLKKQEFNKLWRKVPQIGLFSQLGLGEARNLDAALQTVNSQTIFNKPAGTLKFEGYELRPLESPLPPEIQGSLIGRNLPIGIPNLMFDVLLSWSFFDPTYDVTANNNNPTRGHNNAPFRGRVLNPNGWDGTGNILWYKVQCRKSKNLMFPVYDHRLIFEPVS